MLAVSDAFESWLQQTDVSIAFTTYQARRLFFIGRTLGGSINAYERHIEQGLGFHVDDETLWTSTPLMLWRFQNVLARGELAESGADRLFVPREARVTGAVDVHDLALGLVDGTQQPVFVNTLYSCLATLSDEGNFQALWRPPFITALAPEDRCHLNGLAMTGGRPAYLTAFAQTDSREGWRNAPTNSGVIMEVETAETITAGLSMPHSPRLHEGKLWVINSGSGDLGVVDPADGRFTSVCFCPGYARGLAFAGRYALVGLSRGRNARSFEGLLLEKRLKGSFESALCGVMIVDTRAGEAIASLLFEHTIDEIYDVAVLPGVRQPELLTFESEDVQRRVVFSA